MATTTGLPSDETHWTPLPRIRLPLTSAQTPPARPLLFMLSPVEWQQYMYVSLSTSPLPSPLALLHNLRTYSTYDDEPKSIPLPDVTLRYVVLACRSLSTDKHPISRGIRMRQMSSRATTAAFITPSTSLQTGRYVPV